MVWFEKLLNNRLGKTLILKTPETTTILLVIGLQKFLDMSSNLSVLSKTFSLKYFRN